MFESAKKVALGFPPTSETLTGNESIAGLSTMTLPSFTQGVIFLLCNIVKMGVGPQNEAIICQALLLVVVQSLLPKEITNSATIKRKFNLGRRRVNEPFLLMAMMAKFQRGSMCNVYARDLTSSSSPDEKGNPPGVC